MVFFCCNSCGASLKKNAVDKHFMQCRSQSVSCMDCQQDFKGNDYQEHKKCISEQAKYGGPGYKAAEGQNKGEKKQMAWYETVQATLKKAGNSLRPTARNLLQSLTKHENVPRKKPKFFNFVKNVGRNYFDEDTVTLVWDLLETQWKAENQKPGETEAKPEPKSIPASAGAVAKDEAQEVGTEVVSEAPKQKKKKKKKDKGEKTETEQLLETEPDTSMMEIEQEEVSSKKKRKREAEISETVAEVETNGDASEEPPKKKKKKKKKNKQESETEVNGVNGDVNGHGASTTNGVAEADTSSELVIALDESEEKTAKKKKKKKKKSDDGGAKENGKYALLEESVVDGDNSTLDVTDETSLSKKKKKKKNKHELLA